MPQLLPVEHHHQEEPAGCLAACTQMALHFIGISQSQQDLNRLLGLTPAGIPSSRIQRLNQLGVTVIYDTGDEHALREALNQGSPVIVFLLTGDLPYWDVDLRHAVLVIGYDEDEVFISDPAFDDSPKKVNWGDFLLAWSEFDYHYAIISIERTGTESSEN